MMSSLILYGFYYLIKYVDWKFHKQQLNNFLELFFVGCAINATVINEVPVFNGKNLFQYLFKIDLYRVCDNKMYNFFSLS